MDRELSHKPVSFDGLGRVPAREQIVNCLIPTGERKPRVGHREMKFAAMKFACFLSRQQTLCRVIAVASRPEGTAREQGLHNGHATKISEHYYTDAA